MPPLVAPPRRLAALAAVAAAILVGGALARPTRRVPPVQVSGSSSAHLVVLSQSAAADALARAFGDQIAASARHIVPLPPDSAGGRSVSGVRWRPDGTILRATDSASAALVTLADGPSPAGGAARAARATIDSANAVKRPFAQPGTGWVVIVGRTGRDTASAVAWSGGTRGIVCDGRRVEALTLSASFGTGLLGAGVFDLDDNLVGVVLRCGAELEAITPRAVAGLLKRGREPAARLWARAGLRLAVADSVLGASAPDTLIAVAALRRGGPLDLAGLRPGDVLLSMGGRPPPKLDAAVALLADSDALVQAGSLTVSRRGVDRQIRIGAAASGLAPEPLGLTLARGVPLLAVSPGSAAARAGLRAGDRLLEVDGRAVRAESDVASLLRRAARRPVLLVYERDGVLRGAPFGPTQ